MGEWVQGPILQGFLFLGQISLFGTSGQILGKLASNLGHRLVPSSL